MKKLTITLALESEDTSQVITTEVESDDVLSTGTLDYMKILNAVVPHLSKEIVKQIYDEK